MTTSGNIVACWVDQSIGEAGTHLDLKRRFEGVSNRISTWYYFDAGDRFEDFLDANPNMRVVTIMSGHIAKNRASSVCERDNLHSAYVFCGNTQKYQTLLAQEPKIKGILNSEDELFNQMRSELHRAFP